ncbi:MAG: Holliday junction branch migration protein RuvA [Verrucomicrobia bacterium]|nr:MAG: Holliday junction branch migration protein RuvA [Verrucomicrobiota bacterium]
MIVSIKGKVTEVSPLQVVIDVGGIGYAVHIPLTTTELLPPLGHEVYLYTLTVYREDSQALYGFKKREERDFFELLIEKVSGVGPKTALAIMSRLSLPILKDAISRNDITLLSQCPGIGKKTAERLTLELRDKFFSGMPRTSSAPIDFPVQNDTIHAPTIHEDAVAALVKLGLNPATADKSVRKAILSFSDSTPDISSVIKKALG